MPYPAPEFTFVMNPVAGKGAGARIDRLVERLLPGLGVTCEVVRTERPGHATEIARSASSRFIVAVGGDGTVNEVVNGLVGTGKALGIIPAGSGNDFVKSVGIPKQLNDCLAILQSRKIRRIDTGTVTCGVLKDGSMHYAPGRSFINGVGTGFDGQVAWRVSKTRFLRGTLAYFVAVLETLANYRAPEFSVSLDGQASTGRKLLIATGNGKCAGGGFYLTPEAVVDDGWLDACLIEDVPVIKVLGFIPAVMRGQPVHDSVVRYAKARDIAIQSGQKFTVHADGEVVGHDVNGVRMQIVAGSIEVVAGV